MMRHGVARTMPRRGGRAQPRSAADAENERRLLLRWQRFSDAGARDQLVERYMPLARSLARRVGRDADVTDDLTQVACIGLLKAIDGFDPARGCSLASFAAPTIFGELKRHIRDYGWPVHVPRQIRDRTVRIRGVARRLEAELGREPTAAELADACCLERESVIEALEADACARTAPLEGGDRADEAGLDRWLGADDDGYELVEYRDALARRLRGCSDRDRQMLRLRLVDDLSQREIGDRLGLSQMHVSRLLRRLLAEPEVAGGG